MQVTARAKFRCSAIEFQLCAHHGEPAPAASWRPARPGDTPGQLVPGDGDVPPLIEVRG